MSGENSSARHLPVTVTKRWIAYPKLFFQKCWMGQGSNEDRQFNIKRPAAWLQICKSPSKSLPHMVEGCLGNPMPPRREYKLATNKSNPSIQDVQESKEMNCAGNGKEWVGW